MTQETLREAVARIIAAELGDDFDAAFVDKAAWIDARGQSGGRFRDVNEPFQIDYLHAADAAIATMFERLRPPSEAIGAWLASETGVRPELFPKPSSERKAG